MTRFQLEMNEYDPISNTLYSLIRAEAKLTSSERGFTKFHYSSSGCPRNLKIGQHWKRKTMNPNSRQVRLSETPFQDPSSEAGI